MPEVIEMGGLGIESGMSQRDNGATHLQNWQISARVVDRLQESYTHITNALTIGAERQLDLLSPEHISLLKELETEGRNIFLNIRQQVAPRAEGSMIPRFPGLGKVGIFGV